MVSEQPTRKVVKMLKQAGWRPVRAVGSHTIWRSPSGTTLSLPDGHKTISPGVFRLVLRALEQGGLE